MNIFHIRVMSDSIFFLLLQGIIFNGISKSSYFLSEKSKFLGLEFLLMKGSSFEASVKTIIPQEIERVKLLISHNFFEASANSPRWGHDYRILKD